MIEHISCLRCDDMLAPTACYLVTDRFRADCHERHLCRACFDELAADCRYSLVAVAELAD